ncbi:hypothetical protein MUN88_04665 [Gracilibacillus caseinilyticus]|uniref:HEPN domain-containing protein n=1 Tax=Gracilibacillus caseinilyticus TaxID=2932256 RepID=A0ABY4EYB7_9BACI|nr:hypothetical protein [Gracilibacillus caseinilyticus]UOQ49402.1 hypothetical protein MUN88_04665 [Gracilibacillus caseinilyticus]
MATTHGLVNFIKKEKIENHEELVSLLESLLEKEKIHPVIWRYLNKGTHEEERDEEFDRSVVKDVIILLEKIDEVVMNK